LLSRESPSTGCSVELKKNCCYIVLGLAAKCARIFEDCSENIFFMHVSLACGDETLGEGCGLKFALSRARASHKAVGEKEEKVSG